MLSPCISICKWDSATSFCTGCGRSQDDKKIWKEETTSDEWKAKNIEECKLRLSDYNLKLWEENYAYKLKTGMSFIKEERKRKLKELK